jgi:hypothetical protein
MGRRFSGALCVLILVFAGCGDDAAVRKRCEDLEPQLTPAAAWDDPYAVRGAAKEWVELRCEDVIGPRTVAGTVLHTAPR